MWCDAHFNKFNNQLKLDQTRRGRIDSAVAAFEKFCRDDEQLSAAMTGPPFLQGSVATGTAIRPIANDEFDVDVIYPFSLARFGNPTPTPKAILDWFISRLKNRAYYAERLKPKSRCARIDYAGDFHLDIIPSTTEVSSHRPYAVPARDLLDWITNDPHGFVYWVNTLDAQSGWRDASGDGRFVRGVRMLKRWRDNCFGYASAPSSILLVTMLGKHIPKAGYVPPLQDPLYPQYQHDAAYLYDMVRLTVSCIKNPPHFAFMHPTIPGDDLARGWDTDYLELFTLRLELFALHLGQGILAQTDAEAVGRYRNAFGDTFPLEAW
ncbi:nucleotidyltransferase [Aquisphaera insulae]|uniref:nucleotidyltransferase n=1 Tax=Aquisphaera insulae TaxID=2712864 RepID=UPI0013EAF853|nr:nucleotidyltransferase [Aquisphaera insulae]